MIEYKTNNDNTINADSHHEACIKELGANGISIESNDAAEAEAFWKRVEAPTECPKCGKKDLTIVENETTLYTLDEDEYDKQYPQIGEPQTHHFVCNDCDYAEEL